MFPPAETAIEIKKPRVKKPAKPRVKKPTEPEATEELTIEFEHKPEPVQQRMIEPAPAILIEPEPLELINETVTTDSPSPGGRAAEMERGPGGEAWLDDERLEDADLRKTELKLAIDGITVAFEMAYGDEDETLMVVNDVSWRAMLTSPALNLSKMVQILRVSYGELYILGRMALGAMSGDGYITASSAAEVVRALAAATGKTLELDVSYYDKDNTSKKRIAQTIHIRFERA